SRIVEQGDANLGANVVHSKFVKNAVTQVVGKRIGSLEDLVKLGARETHTIGEMRRKYASARKLGIDESLVLISLTPSRVGAGKSEDGFIARRAAWLEDRLRRQVPVRHAPFLPRQNVYGMA
ncbi:hypothetical protein OY671_011484, partial [Metschnikowia pulcherrima]